MHPSALLVKLVTVSSGEKERERKIGKERQEEKTREKRRKIKGSICVFFVCVCFVSYSLPIFMTAQNEGERKCVLERQWARPGSRVQTSAIELLIKSHNKKIIPCVYVSLLNISTAIEIICFLSVLTKMRSHKKKKKRKR